MDKVEFFAKAARLPDYSDDMREADSHIRQHMITDLFDVFIPLPRHYWEHTVLARMIRRGYVARANPADRDYWQQLNARLEQAQRLRIDPSSIRSPLLLVRVDGASSDLTTTKIGVSGCGKSRSADINLSMYPQVIEHGEYQGKRINIRQVTWLKVQAPHLASTKDICIQILRQIDSLLGTNYAERLNKKSVDEMLDIVSQAAGTHALGLLVIDEAQEFSNRKSGGQEGLAAFTLRMNNGIGVPQVMIGTYKIRKFLYDQLRTIRRSTGIGMPEWGAFEHSPHEWRVEPKPPTTEWITYLRRIWRYQYTRKLTPLSEELSETLYDECQGIADFATKIYFLVQDRLIATSTARGSELITPGLLRAVARDYLQPAREHLRAIKERDIDRLAKLEDVKLPTMAEYLKRQQDAGEFTSQYERPDQPHGQPDGSEIGHDIPPAEPEKVKGKATKSAPSLPHPAKIHSVLKDVVGKSEKEPDECYEKLRQAGFIKMGTEFLDGFQ
jgi:hypothetical protein